MQLVFSFEPSGIVLLNVNSLIVNLSLYDGNETLAVIIFVLAGALLAVSVEEARKKADGQGCWQRTVNSIRGISKVEALNFSMIILVFIDLGLKYNYDSIARSTFNRAQGTDFVSFSREYLYYESLTLLDALTIFLMSLAVIRYVCHWFPRLEALPRLLSLYLTSSVRSIFLFVVLVCMAFALYFHFFYSGMSIGFSNYAYALMRTSVLLMQGCLFDTQTFLLVEETPGYLQDRVGWVATLLNMGVIYLFARYVVLTVVIATLRRDIKTKA